MEQHSSNRGRSAFAAASLIGIATAGVLIALQRRGQQRSTGRRARAQGIYVHEAITVNRPLAEVYQFWRNFENFRSFMSHLESIRTDIIGEQEHEWIAWRSIDGSDLQHSGSVRFEHAPGARGTEVHVQLRYEPHGGTVGHAIARLFGEDPERRIREDLRRFKQLLEVGEIPVSDGPGLWRPAQPAERPEDIKAHMGVLR